MTAAFVKSGYSLFRNNYGLFSKHFVSPQGSNNVALGYDDGSLMIKLGREEPAMSMDNNGKIIWAKHSEIQQANLKAMAGNRRDLKQALLLFESSLAMFCKDQPRH